MKIYRLDTPLANTPEPTPEKIRELTRKDKEENKENVSDVKVTDVGTALADITKRAAARQAAKNASNKKVRDDIAERRAKEGKKQTGTGKLIGLKGLGDYGSKM